MSVPIWRNPFSVCHFYLHWVLWWRPQDLYHVLKMFKPHAITRFSGQVMHTSYPKALQRVQNKKGAPTPAYVVWWNVESEHSDIMSLFPCDEQTFRDNTTTWLGEHVASCWSTQHSNVFLRDTILQYHSSSILSPPPSLWASTALSNVDYLPVHLLVLSRTAPVPVSF